MAYMVVGFSKMFPHHYHQFQWRWVVYLSDKNVNCKLEFVHEGSEIFKRRTAKYHFKCKEKDCTRNTRRVLERRTSCEVLCWVIRRGFSRRLSWLISGKDYSQSCAVRAWFLGSLERQGEATENCKVWRGRFHVVSWAQHWTAASKAAMFPVIFSC